MQELFYLCTPDNSCGLHNYLMSFYHDQLVRFYINYYFSCLKSYINPRGCIHRPPLWSASKSALLHSVIHTSHYQHVFIGTNSSSAFGGGKTVGAGHETKTISSPLEQQNKNMSYVIRKRNVSAALTVDKIQIL